MEYKTAYVLSQPLLDDDDRGVYIPKDLDKMVIFAGINYLLENTFESIMTNIDPKTGQEYRMGGSVTDQYFWSYKDEYGHVINTEHAHTNSLPRDLISTLGICGGDKLTLAINSASKRIIITQINGKEVKKVPNIYEQTFQYPTEYFPVDSFGFHALRCMSSRAPLGFGSTMYTVAPGTVGKTSLMLELWEASIRLTQTRKDLFLVTLLIGERTKDGYLYKVVKDNISHDNDRVELYSASVGLQDFEAQWRIFEYLVTQRIRALARHYKVFTIIDSLHQAALTHSNKKKSKLEQQGGMISGGLSTNSMFTVVQRVAVTGNFGKTSLSIMNVLLGNYPKTTREVPPALARISTETKDNVPEVIWQLNEYPFFMEYPYIDPSKTATRRIEYFAPPALINEIRSDNEHFRTHFSPEQHSSIATYIQESRKRTPIGSWIKDPQGIFVPIHLQPKYFNLKEKN